MPDIDSLPHSFSLTRSNSSALEATMHGASPSSRASTFSTNAGIQHQDGGSPINTSIFSSFSNRPASQVGRSERRRSNILANPLFDPTSPGPGELHSSERRSSLTPATTYPYPASPQSLGSPTMMAARDRAPSLGELHQELEAEQEAQVNRLLEMIRQQQAQLQAIQQTAAYNPISGSSTIDYSENTASIPDRTTSALPPFDAGTVQPRSRSPLTPFTNPRSTSGPSFRELVREQSRRSRPPSQTASPALRPLSLGLNERGTDWLTLNGREANRDECAYYQAEATALTRENQMLRQRIRELERQVSENNSATPNSPATPSNLTAPPLEAESTEGVLDSNVADADQKEA